MSAEKKLTAVEWLVIEIKKLTGLKIQDEDIIQQAKEKEKQQIIDAFDDGQANYTLPRDFYNGKKYYNEIYKKD